MKRKARAMDAPQKQNIRPCSVVVRRLTLGEICRLTISPFFISNRCGRCNNLVYYGPRCTTCSVSYHYNCALLHKMCCDLDILFHQDNSFKQCRRCNQDVDFGPSCSLCNSKFHSYCLTPYDQCCKLNLCQLPHQRFCNKCKTVVIIGPTCPICSNIYHLECVKKGIWCCGLKVVCEDDNFRYKCKRCHKSTRLASVMCQFCGEVYHRNCLRAIKKCCGKCVPLEIFLIPSFKSVSQCLKVFDKRRAAGKQFEEKVVINQPTLRSKIKNANIQERVRRKTASSQTSALDSITIVSVKTELEQKELDIPSSPPVLERERSFTPEPSSSLHRPDSSVDSDETLKNLFDFLYNMVKKFPPQLQTQVKIDLFKTVTEAEMKLRCNMVNELQHNGK